MSDYEEWFDQQKHLIPKMTNLKHTAYEGEPVSPFWENMYQAFKQRLCDEVMAVSDALPQPASLIDVEDRGEPVDEEYEPGWDDPRKSEKYDRGVEPSKTRTINPEGWFFTQEGKEGRLLTLIAYDPDARCATWDFHALHMLNPEQPFEELRDALLSRMNEWLEEFRYG